MFRNWYDRYIKFLDYFKYADCYQFTRNSILPKDKVFAVNENLFIQFCEKKSMNGHFGYIWREKFRPLQPTEIFRRGYQPIEKIIDYMPNPEVNRNPRNFSRFWFG